ncbi:Hypothetical protein NTJ_14213 [Nesidiocoris tenuis]|uniref:OCRE domain-containing protein n=1 Tax=Nesidiocoris tenuis TaxID=355587 RepID=A0ABN7BAI1_9HEMI|nr:Hypothetical protein NTJ_14213 [Nesidiocoris tenuis]
MKLCLAILTVGLCVSVAVAQYDGPLPPRPIIPGAAPVGYSPGSGGRPSLRRRPVSRGFSDEQPPPRRPNSRGAAPRRLPPPIGLEQSLQARPPPPRPLYQDSPIAVVRPPILSSPPQVRPVVEDDDDEDSDSYEDRQPQTQQPFHPTPQQQLPQPTPPQQLFNSIDDFPVPTRQQFRPQQQQIQQEEEQPQQQQFVRQSRPQQAAPVRQQTQAEIPRQEPARPKPYANQQYNRQQQVARPVQKEIAHSKATDQPTNRQKKPTSQTLRKYRDDNPDGSITWGYENDDGSFKEETIGVDCVTRGKYGYVDPDGVRREYTYSSGIPCDKTQEDAETQASEGYIDYTNNKYVFANGATIDLDNMVRNRARKPVYRN